MTATTTIPIEGIMTFLNSMSLTAQNKRWLGEHLIEQAEQEQRLNDAEAEKIHVMKGLDAAFKDVKLAREGKLKGHPLKDLLNEI